MGESGGAALSRGTGRAIFARPRALRWRKYMISQQLRKADGPWKCADAIARAEVAKLVSL
jgi:hypothetical protein